ncbi:MAG: TIM barrel protein [Phycisphaera sp.]|nr:TIM barrel protein [Phycisphaera sp.]
MQIGYCTNVHAGPTLETMRANLERHALAVKQRVRPEGPMGVGLWLANDAAAQIAEGDEAARLRDWLAERGLVPFTINGFPYGDFHEPIVKHRVYKPTWYDQRRVTYTRNLINVMHEILPEGVEGSISTLPLSWGWPEPTPHQLEHAATHLRVLATQMARLEADTGRLLHVCIEPEPGCAIQTSDDIVRFFEDYLLKDGDEATTRRHVRVCHDVCHAAVMFEPQADVLRKFAAAGIGVGKVQVSSAVIVRFDAMAPDDRPAALDQLRGFAEDRYLHQTCVRKPGDDDARFVEDLPQALAEVDAPAALNEEWRIHFHVPIYLDKFGLLGTSRDDITACLAAVREHHPACDHFEVETYAWGVLPKELQQPELAAGIADEIKWFDEISDQ